MNHAPGVEKLWKGRFVVAHYSGIDRCGPGITFVYYLPLCS